MQKTNSKLSRGRAVGGFQALGGSFGGGGGVELPAGTVTFHELIGAHNISVVRVERREGFIKWSKDYLKSLKVDAPIIPKPLAKVVDEYIQDGYTWFVFDVVSLTRKPITKQAIQFRFETQFLYYPLRITRTEHGNTEIKLLILTKGLFQENMCLGIPRRSVYLPHHPVSISGSELKDLGAEIYDMLEQPKQIKIRNWHIRGKLSSFKQDLLMGDPKKYREYVKELNRTRAAGKAAGGPK